MKISIKENMVQDENGITIFTTPQKIEKLLEVSDFFVVQMPGYVSKQEYMRHNVWCFDKKSGEKIWEIEPVKSATKYDTYSNTYTENGKLFVVSGSGISSQIDINTGKILNTEFLK